MLCNHCHGKHLTVVDGRVQPCDECGGLGEVHCCEGLQAQPETDLAGQGGSLVSTTTFMVGFVLAATSGSCFPSRRRTETVNQ